MNLGGIIEAAVGRIPDKPALIFEGNRISYRELMHACDMVGSGLKSLGIRRGDRVAILLPNVPEFIMTYLGILRIGATVVPMNTMYRAGEIKYIMENCGVRAAVASAGMLPHVSTAIEGNEVFQHLIIAGGDPGPSAMSFDQLQERGVEPIDVEEMDPDDVAVILYTSGTTGHPKGAMIMHRNLLADVDAVVSLAEITARDVSMVVLPLFHCYGATVSFLSPLSVGATLVVVPRFDPETAMATIERERVTFFCGVPTMYVYMLHHNVEHDMSSIRLMVSGGASIAVEVLEGFRQKYKLNLIEGYGLTENSPVASLNPLDRQKAGSIGKPIKNVQMMIAGDDGRELPPGTTGELLVGGAAVMKGYYNMPEETAATIIDGWLHTGDVCYMDEDGFFYLVDRKKDMIIKGGFNVYPREVEELLYAHPKVLEAAVVGVPDWLKGEVVKACVVPRTGEQLSEQEVIDYCRERIAAYKAPNIVEIRTSLPKNATGKILKRELRAEAVAAAGPRL